MGGTAEDVIRIALEEVGYCRWDDPREGTKYGRWAVEELGYEPSYASAAFCAMGASWVLAQAGVTCSGMPSPYCPAIEAFAIAAGRATSPRDARRGDLILFDWDGDREADHVGIVLDPQDGFVDTVEFNTRGEGGRSGSVAVRRRDWRSVTHLVRPDYDAGLVVDGYWGPETTRALQRHYGTIVDGEIWHQRPHSAQPACTAGWFYDWTYMGSRVIRALQQDLGVPDDGLLGGITIRALQRRLGTPADGRLDAPSRCVMALQRALNEGTL